MTTVHVNAPSKSYDVIIGNDAIARLPELIGSRKAFIITDENVWNLHPLTLIHSELLILPPGENTKSLESARILWNAFVAANLKRDDVIVAYGGGVIGDLSGFVASTYMRGTPFIQVATTLVSQIDSSVGGKTGVNLPSGKNLIGTFYQPEAVICDTHYLSTLQDRELKAGLAEAIKYGLITPNAPQFSLSDLQQLVEFCIRAKSALVEQDETDTGIRMFLNFGHTFGHAIEKKFNYERFNHGEAVAKGMALALRVGVSLGITSESVCNEALSLIIDAGLDISLDFNPRELIPLMSTDKKNTSGGLQLVLLKSIGVPIIVPIKKIAPSPNAKITLPPSKSILHRELICSHLSGSPLELSSYISDDISATKRCICALLNGETILDCGESGSTLRFLIPLAAALGKNVTFTGHGRLLLRPLEPLLEQLNLHGVTCTKNSDTLTLSGCLTSGSYELPGDVSSQFITGLLFALPLVGGGSITLTSPLQSHDYVILTLQALRRYGITAIELENGYSVQEGKYRPAESHEIEADWSQAAFFLVAKALGCHVDLTNLNYDSMQGDCRIAEIISQSVINDKIIPQTIDVSEIPDLVPPLAALLCFADGVSHLTNAARLRLKESNRLESVCNALNTLGGSAKVAGDTLIITGVSRLRGGSVNPQGDHRIAMMAAVLAIRSNHDVWLADYDCVRKSYPNFWKDFEVQL
jgi:3-dehydroquinate synthase/3-phosphoshikimate 1-carboxyvinyltransferase